MVATAFLKSDTSSKTAIERIADELMAQYELSYVLPDGVDPTDRLEITSKRKNVKVQAPTRIAN